MLQIHLLVLSLIGQIIATPALLDRPLLQRDPNNPLLIFASGKTDNEDKFARSIPPADLTGMGFGLNAFGGTLPTMNPLLSLRGFNPLNNFGGIGMPLMFNRFSGLNTMPYSNFGANTLGGINNYNGLNGLTNFNLANLNNMGLNNGLVSYAGLAGLNNGLTGFSSFNQLNIPTQFSSYGLNNLNGFSGLNGVNGFSTFNAGFNGLNGVNNLNSIPYNQFSSFSNGNRFNIGRDVSSVSSTDNDAVKRLQSDPTSPYYVQMFDGYGSTSLGGNREEQQDSFGGQKRNTAATSQIRANKPSL